MGSVRPNGKVHQLVRIVVDYRCQIILTNRTMGHLGLDCAIATQNGQFEIQYHMDGAIFHLEVANQCHVIDVVSYQREFVRWLAAIPTCTQVAIVPHHGSMSMPRHICGQLLPSFNFGIFSSLEKICATKNERFSTQLVFK